MLTVYRAKNGFPQTWEEVCRDPVLAELPYRVEINRRGNLELSPHSRSHSKYQTAIQRLLDRLLKGGVTFQECAIKSRESTPVADVVWVSRARDASDGEEFACSIAPEICVEVRSPSNSLREMQDKRQEYFDAGAVECWFCDLTGGMSFYSLEGELESSRLCPKFPKQIRSK